MLGMKYVFLARSRYRSAFCLRAASPAISVDGPLIVCKGTLGHPTGVRGLPGLALTGSEPSEPNDVPAGSRCGGSRR